MFRGLGFRVQVFGCLGVKVGCLGVWVFGCLGSKIFEIGFLMKVVF